MPEYDLSSLNKKPQQEPQQEPDGFGDLVSDAYGAVGEGISENSWLGPAIGLGAVGGAVKAAPAIAAGARAAGKGGMAYGGFRLKAGAAVAAFDLGRDFAEFTGQETEFRKDVFGGAASAGGYLGVGLAGKVASKGLNVLAAPLSKNFMANLAVGSWSGQVAAAMKVVEEGAEEGARLSIKRDIMGTKNYKGGKTRAKVNRAWDSPKRMEKEVKKRVAKATSSVEKALAEKIKKQVLTTSAKKKSFDKVLTKLATNPGKVTHLARLLGKQFPKLSMSLSASVGGIMLPEAASTIIGGLGLAWTVYDIYQIMETYPDIGRQINGILFGEDASTDDIVNSMAKGS